MFSWDVAVDIRINADKESVWKIFKDTDNWHVWYQGIEWCKLNAPFAKGSQGQIKAKGWPASTFTIEEITETGFITKASMPKTTLSFHYMMKEEEGTLKVSLKGEVNGMLAPMLYLSLKTKLSKELKESLEALKILAEKVVTTVALD